MEISIAPTSPIWIPKSSSSSNSGRRSLNCSSESFVQQPPSPTTNEKTIANIKDLIEKIATSVVSAPNALNGKIQEKAEDIFQTKNEKIDNASEGKQEIESNNNEMDIDEKMHLDWYPQVSEDSTTNDLLSQEEEIQENFRFQSLVEEWENEQYYDERCYDSFFSDEESGSFFFVLLSFLSVEQKQKQKEEEEKLRNLLLLEMTNEKLMTMNRK